MKQPSPVPALARRLLERTLPADVRDGIAGDLAELFHRDLATKGPLTARFRYWSRAISLSRAFALERLRDRGRHTDWTMGFSWMDWRLGVRMLVRYPGLTLVGVFGMAVGITIAAGAFSIIDTFTDPALPLDEGDRVITVQNWDAETHRPERHLLGDFLLWRAELKSLTDLGVYRHTGRNLIIAGARPESVRIAEMSAAGFRVARVQPMMGRPLVDADERPAAPPVVVIGHDVWKNRLNADPEVLSHTLQLGSIVYDIVGVMPQGFGFPVGDQLWVPFRANAVTYEPLKGPELTLFGRLAPGATLKTAQAELTAIGQRTAAASPATHTKVRPSVLPYTYPFFDIDSPEVALLFRMMKYVLALLLVVVCVNVSILVYARTATRENEIAVRSALGASRGRIVTQLFVEALVLAAGGAIIGLALTSYGLRQISAAMDELLPTRPFWWTFEMSPAVVLYVLVLTVLAAVIVGVVPALKATGRRVQNRLQTLSAGGGAGMQLGSLWTLLIVAQVGMAVALLPAAVYQTYAALHHGLVDPGYAAHEFFSAQLVLERAPTAAAAANVTDAEFNARFAAREAEVIRRLQADPSVDGVTFALTGPGGEMAVFMEAEGIPQPQTPTDYALADGTNAGRLARFNRVDIGYFDTFRVPVLAGRRFDNGDTTRGSNAIIVNRSFVREVLADQPALGRRVRLVGRSREADPNHVVLNRWYEIVGVVEDFPSPASAPDTSAKLYYAAAPGQVYPSTLAMHLRGEPPANFADHLRELGAAVDPNLQVRNIANLDDSLRREQGAMRMIALGLGLVTLSVVVLSSAGIYALMSFTVARRRKEIGIRAALGADPRRILGSIFSRAFLQLGAGASAGIVTALLLDALTNGELMAGNARFVLPIVAVLMVVIGLLAAAGPARRGLRIQPTEALREQ